jgi:hypothetical protein
VPWPVITHSEVPVGVGPLCSLVPHATAQLKVDWWKVDFSCVLRTHSLLIGLHLFRYSVTATELSDQPTLNINLEQILFPS